MNCPKCGTANDEAFRFCLKCGSSLEAPAAQGNVPPGIPYTPQPGAATSNPPQTPAYVPPQPVNPLPPLNYAPQPAARQYIPPTPPGYPQQQVMQQQQNWSSTPYFPESQNISMLHIWGPFAGFGTRRKHLGWLLDNRGDSSTKLSNQVKTLFQERQVSGVMITEETLIARGLVVENRPYFILRRRLASVGLNITQFGKDLFISLVSYLKPPISNFRVMVLIVMALFWLYMTFIYPSALQGSLTGLFNANALFGGTTSRGSGGSLTFLLCVLGPAGLLNSLAMGIFVIYSVYKWLTEKDLWAGLRTTPNEFNEDDLMAMEKAAEQTVRMAMDDIGLDPDDLMPTSLQSSARII